MMRTICISAINILLYALGLSQGQLSIAEKDSVNNILVRVLDTLSVKLDPSYSQILYPDHPNGLRSRLHKGIHESGYSLRPDISFYKGLADAERDLAQGRFIEKGYGLGTAIEFQGKQWSVEKVYAYILFTKFRCSSDPVAGDIVDESLVAYANGYKLLARPVINIYYGKDIFASARELVPSTIEDVGEQFKDKWVIVK
jgi:hypothetical protein